MSQSSAQIRQMCNFILQESIEKSNEIRLKTEHDFNLEKQTLLHNAKLRIQDEFKEMEKEREVKRRIEKSTEVGNSKVQKMKARDNLLVKLQETASQRAASISSDQNYPSLLQKLIVQGLIKIEEDIVTIYCRAEDVSVVEKVLPQAITEYKQIMKKAAGVDLNPNVTINKDASMHLTSSTGGGVTLTADEGRIVCDNTMEARLRLTYEELLPSIRAILFGEIAHND